MIKTRVVTKADGYFFKFRKYVRIPHVLSVMELLKKLSKDEKDLLDWILSKTNGCNSMQIHVNEDFKYSREALIRLIQLDVIIPFVSEGKFSILKNEKIKLMVNPAKFLNPKVYSAERRTNNYKNQKRKILIGAPPQIVELYGIKNNIDKRIF